MMYFREILSSSNIRVEGYMGSYNPPGGFQTIQMAIGTIEKCNSLINRLLEENKLSDLGLIIIDEIHLIGDSSRGYLLELLLTKLKYIMLKNNDIKIQIVGMSATLPNLSALADWLDAELYTTNFRPIPLHEMVYVNRELYDKDFKLVKRLESLPDLATDTDDILQLCLETVERSCSVLIFCSTKNWCENLAQQIAGAFWKLGTSNSDLGQVLRDNLSTEKIQGILEQLKYCPSGLDKILKNTIAFGVAFHHAGLTMEEREIIEGGFRNGAVRVLVATSTLSSGVNLPARRVIIRSPLFNSKPMDILTYRQMIGRAGRMGIDTEGQSILICQKADYKVAKYLTNSDLKPVKSCLNDISKFKRAILEIIASGIAATPEDVNLFQNNTLAAKQSSNNSQEIDPIQHVVDFLEKFCFIRLQKIDDGSFKYVPTGLGKACLSSSLPPGEGLELFNELEKARQCFVLECELHLIYLVTPYSACYQWSNIDWMFYLDLWEKLPSSMKRVGELVGVRDSFIIKSTRGNPPNDPVKLLIHKRFFVALSLQDLVNEKSLDEVCIKFNCNRGMLQSLQQSAATFAGMVTSFSRQLGWSTVEILVSQFQDRLQFGVNRDLLDLMRISCLDGKRARAFHNSGIENLVQLANSDVYTIENILHKVLPFESSKEREGETDHDFKQRNKLRTVWITGNVGLTEREAAEIILKSAREYLEHEMGVSDIKWGVKDDISSVESESLSQEILESSNEQENLTNNTFTVENIITPLKKNTNDEKISPKRVNNDLSHSQEDLFKECLEETIDKVSNLTVNNRKRNGVEQVGISLSAKKKKINHTISSDLPKTLFPNKNSDLLKFTIIETNKHKHIYDSFYKELSMKNEISLSLACSEVDDGVVIGTNIKLPKAVHKYSDGERKVEGLTLTWDGKQVYFVSLKENLPTEKYLKDLELVLSRKDLRVKMFDGKENIIILKRALGINLCGQIEDVKVMDFLLSNECCEKNIHQLIDEYLPTAKGFCKSLSNYKSRRSIGLNVKFEMGFKMRSSIESVLTWHLVKEQLSRMEEYGSRYTELLESEIASVSLVAQMELVGLGVDRQYLMSLIDSIKTNSSCIEQKVFELAGKKFNLSSRREVAQVIGLTRNKNSSKRKVSTSKKVLEHNDNPISEYVLLWRKLGAVRSKLLQPLLATVSNGRVYGKFIQFTATGRFSMHEPNLQTVNKDFEFENPVTKESVIISCRNVFTAQNGYVLLSIDYCQLELRMLAHLSQDENLCRIMRRKGDIFKLIAAKWNKITEKEVTDKIRQQTKNICYGIIYGMGSKALADQLGIEPEEASVFMDEFKNAYPGIKCYIADVMEKCKNKGYIETLLGRRRYLPLINDTNITVKSHAERQALNSTIQGSASDLVKKSMKLINDQFKSMNGEDIPRLILHLHDELLFEVRKDLLQKTATILKSCMESALNLSIPFPVKIKVGPSWGCLNEYCDI